MRNRIINKESGQGLVEYGLILALVSVVAVGSLGGVSQRVANTFSAVDDAYFEAKINMGYIPIATAEELNNLRNKKEQLFGVGTDWEGHYDSGLDRKYIQVSDIDLGLFSNWEPIGDEEFKFEGTFDGGGYVIKNLTVDNGLNRYAGLFGYANGAQLSNVGLVDVNVTSGGNYTGGLVGRQNYGSQIHNSYVTGEVTGTNHVGVLVGEQHVNSKTINSYARGKSTGSRYVGGLIGNQHTNSTITDSFFVGVVEGYQEVGGLVGLQYLHAGIINSYVQANVLGVNRVGAFLGDNYNGRGSGFVTKSGWDKDHIGSEYKGFGQDSENIIGRDDLVGYTSSEIDEFIKGLIK